MSGPDADTISEIEMQSQKSMYSLGGANQMKQNLMANDNDSYNGQVQRIKGEKSQYVIDSQSQYSMNSEAESQGTGNMFYPKNKTQS